MSATHKVSIFLLLLIIVGFSNHDDFQLLLKDSGMNKLSVHMIPLMTEEMLALTIEPQTFSEVFSIPMPFVGNVDTTVTMKLGPITIKNFTIVNITVSLDSSTQKLTMNVINMALKLNTFDFSVTARIGIDLTCSGSLSPEFKNWNMSVTFNTSTNNCSMAINLIKSDTIITEGPISLNQNFNNKACNTIYEAADFLLEIEDVIKDEIMAQIPDVINNELQTALNGFISKSETMGDIGMCYTNTTVYTNHLLIGANFIIPSVEDRKLGNPFRNRTTTPVTSTEEPINDDASLLVFFIIILILSGMIGCGVGIGVFCGCNKEKLKQLRKVKDTTGGEYDQIEVQPMRVNDNMTDDDGIMETK